MHQRNLFVAWYRTGLLFGFSLFGLLSASASAAGLNSSSLGDGSPREVGPGESFVSHAGNGVDKTTRTIAGRVLTPEGRPARNALVISDLGGRATTDAQGVFRLSVVLPRTQDRVRITAIDGRQRNLQGSRSVTISDKVKQAPLGDLELAYTFSCTPLWLPTFEGYGGPDGNVQCMAVFDDGSGPGLFVAGQFKSASGLPATNIAKWDGTGWSALGPGLNASVISLQVFDDGGGEALYAGGTFTASNGSPLNSIAKWDGAGWTPLGNGVNGAVRTLAVFDDGSGPVLCAGGTFSSAGSVLVNSVAQWDGTQWSALDTGLNIYPNALKVFDDGGGAALYAGGGFTSAGGVSTNHIAKWDGAYWSPVGTGVSGALSAIYALEVFDDGSGAALYAGGRFSDAGLAPAKNLARWDGSNWSALGGGGTNKIVTALHAHNDASGNALFVGGAFFQAGGVPALKIAKWDGAGWTSLGGGLEGGSTVFDFESFDQGGGLALFAGGDFDSQAEAQDRFLAKWGCHATDNDYGAYCFGDGSLASCPCGNEGDQGEGCLNSSGSGALLWADGSASVLGDDFRLFASQLIPGRSALLLSGTATMNGGQGAFSGDGLTCVAGGIRSLGVRVSNSSGETRWGPGLMGSQGWSAGDFRTFQVVYRDLAGFPCGSMFNRSNGVRAVLQP